MPEPHVDQAYQAASNLIQFKKFPATEEQENLSKLSTDERKAYQKNKEDSEGKKMGKRVFNEIESSNLTPSEKQEVYLKLAQEGVKKEIAENEHLGTLMRVDTALTQFMSNYMGTYAKGYIEAMTQTAVEEVGKVKLPGWTKGKALGGIDAPIDGVSEDQLKEFQQVYVDLSRKMAQASEDHLSKLSPEARIFLASTLAPLREVDLAAMNFLATNTLILRTVNPSLTVAAGKMEDKNLGRMVVNTSVVFQSYSNRLTSTSKGTKPQDNLAENLISDEGLKANTFRLYSALTNPDSVDDLIKLNAKSAELKQRNQIGGGLDKLDAILEKLNKSGPSFEKLKAKLSEGGIEGAKQKFAQEIKELKKLGLEVDTLGLKLASGGGLKDRMEMESVLEVQTPSQTTTIQPQKDDLKQNIGNTQSLTPEKSGKGIDDLEQLIQDIAIEVELEQLEPDQMSITPKDVIEDIELTPEDINKIESQLKELDMGIDQEAVDLKELEDLILELQAAELDPQLKTANAPKPDVSAYETRIQNLQKERQRLENPTAGDRIKAFFQHGFKGVKGEREQLDAKIEATKAAKEMVLSGVSTDVQRQKIQELKELISETKNTLQVHKAVLTEDALYRSGITTRSVTKQQIETAQIEGQKAEQRLSGLKTELKKEERVLTVREKLGMQEHKTAQGVKAPRQGMGV